MPEDFNNDKFIEEIKLYGRKWVALVDHKVVAAGGSLREVEEKAEQAGYQEYATFLVPPSDASFVPLGA